MLTGDKGETARMIGISCGLLQEGMKLIKIDDDLESVQPIIQMANDSQNFEIMISGRSLSQLLNRPECKKDLNDLLSNALAVLVYRASPA